MLAFLLSLLTRFSVPQVVLMFSVSAIAAVAVAGSAELTLGSRSVAVAEESPAALAVLQSTVEVDPVWTIQRVSYQLADVPTSVDAIKFTLVAPEVKPTAIVVQAAHPAGTFYYCSVAPAATGADVQVTCPTQRPALQVAQANRLVIEVRG